LLEVLDKTAKGSRFNFNLLLSGHVKLTRNEITQ
jgi:hypothetical protein